MTTPDLLTQNSNFRKTYSAAELDEIQQKSAELRLKSTFINILEHNLQLVKLVQEYIDFVDGKTTRPQEKLWEKLRPGHTDMNPACVYLGKLKIYYCTRDMSNLPQMDEIIDAGRSTYTLLEKLSELYDTTSLSEAKHQIDQFFCLITGNCPVLSKSEFGRLIETSIDRFTAACIENSIELQKAFHSTYGAGKLAAPDAGPVTKREMAVELNRRIAPVQASQEVIIELEKSTNKTAAANRRSIAKLQRKSRPKDEHVKTKEDIAVMIWNQSLGDAYLRSLSNQRLTRTRVYEYRRRDLNAAGIGSADEFERLLINHSKRCSRKKAEAYHRHQDKVMRDG